MGQLQAGGGGEGREIVLEGYGSAGGADEQNFAMTPFLAPSALPACVSGIRPGARNGVIAKFCSSGTAGGTISFKNNFSPLASASRL